MQRFDLTQPTSMSQSNMKIVARGASARFIRREAVLREPSFSFSRPKTIGEANQPNNVAIFVEPSPFSHVSGMKNRFECLIRGLRDAGDKVTVITPDPEPPAAVSYTHLTLPTIYSV